MKKINEEIVYGFTVENKDHIGFTRWINNAEEINAHEKFPLFPVEIHKLYVLQHFSPFMDAYLYCYESTRDNTIRFKALYENDYQQFLKTERYRRVKTGLSLFFAVASLVTVITLLIHLS